MDTLFDDSHLGGWSKKKIINVYLRKRKINDTRRREIDCRKDTDHLYLWYLTQHRQHREDKGLMEANTFILNQVNKIKLPIYMETTEPRLSEI